jgi:hypothetical protein
MESVNCVNSFFANVGKRLAEDISSGTALPVANPTVSTSKSQLSSFGLIETDPQEVDSIISNLKSESAPGWDGIPTKFIKMVKPLVISIITHLANLCFGKGIFPPLLKKSIVTPVFKSGDKIDINNYRPISVLSVISKIIERIINSRLITYLEKFNILSGSQFGFRKAKTTEDAILGLSSLVTQHLDRGEKCLTVFLDLKKAFDTVSVPTLVKKMEEIGVRGIPLKLLADYLEDRSQSVKIDDYISADTKIEFGVPQGSVLGPTLFLIYLNELTNLEIENGKVFSYADDTAIVFNGRSWNSVFDVAERGLRMIAKWLRSAFLTLNIAKTNFICFAINKRSLPPHNLKLKLHYCDSSNTINCGCDEIECVKSTKYLGVVLDHRLSWHPQIDTINDKVRKLNWIFKKLRHITSQDLLKRIYYALAQSVICYCISSWGGASKTKFLEAERAQRCLLKIMFFKRFRFPTDELYLKYKLMSIRKLYIINIVLKLHKTLPYTPNLHIARRPRKVAVTSACRTLFARRQFQAHSAYLYNKLHEKYNIYNLQYYECKKTLLNRLDTLGYCETENLLFKYEL